MRVVGALIVSSLLGLVGACSAGAPIPGGLEPTVQSTSEAITAACNTSTIGFPCDPDGPAGPLLECEGVCALGTTGLAQCSTIKDAGLKNLDGRVCGDTSGIGDVACAHRCIGRGCVATNAPAGAACRPGSQTSPCDGQCDGNGACTPIAQACDYGRKAQLCVFDTCNFVKATACTTLPLTESTICADNAACRIGACDAAGSCVPGDQIGCDDGNPCTDDACDPKTGGCIGTPNDSNPCTDNDVCSIGDHCSAGACVPGSTHPNCNDGNVCTNDGCDPASGCTHFAHCGDGNYCTTDICDPVTAACSWVPLTCADNDPCTVDSCDRAGFKCDHVFTASDTCIAPPSGGSGGTGGSDATAGEGGVAAGDTGGTDAGGTTAGSSSAGTSSGAAAGTTASGGTEPVDNGGTSPVGASGAPDGSKPATKDSSGCGCRTAGGDSAPNASLLAITALAFAAMRRRRQRLVSNI